jgi:hypothetical protein
MLHPVGQASLSQSSPASQAGARPGPRAVRRSPATQGVGRDGGLRLIPSPSSRPQSGGMHPPPAGAAYGIRSTGVPPLEGPHRPGDPPAYPALAGACRGPLFGGRQSGPAGAAGSLGRPYPAQQVMPEGSWPGAVGTRGSEASSLCSRAHPGERSGAPAHGPAGQNINPNITHAHGRPSLARGSGGSAPYGAGREGLPASAQGSGPVLAMRDPLAGGHERFGGATGWAGPPLGGPSSSSMVTNDVIVLESSMDPAEELRTFPVLL